MSLLWYKRGHLKFECKLSKKLKSTPSKKSDKGKSIVSKGKTYKIKEDSKRYEQVRSFKKESPKKKKNMSNLPPLTKRM